MKKQYKYVIKTPAVPAYYASSRFSFYENLCHPLVTYYETRQEARNDCKLIKSNFNDEYSFLEITLEIIQLDIREGRKVN
jgi:hypothetical protein